VAKRQERKKPENEAKKESEGTGPTEFDKLLRFILTFRGRFALAFICGEDRRQRQGILASLADLLKEKGVELRHIDLTYREATDLLATLREECGQSTDRAIVVTGIEASLKGPFPASLNLQRDLMSQDIKCPILFWVSTFALNLFAREAPDFYDFRHTVFNFKGAERKGVPTDTAIRASEIRSEQGRGSEERTSYLLRQLEKYRKDESSLGLREKLAYGELLEEIARSYRGERHRTEALVYLQEALDIYKSFKPHEGVKEDKNFEKFRKNREAAVLQAIGDIYYFSDNQNKARESLEKALPIHREIGNRLGEANALKSLGDVKRVQSEYGEAERLYQQALPIHREIGNRLGEANALQSLGDVKMAQSDYAEAERLYQQALPIHREIGNRLGEANVLKSLGDVKRMRSDYVEAEGLYLRALGIFATIDDKYSQGTTLLSLVEVYRSLGQKQKAAFSARRAKELLASFPKLVKRCNKLLQELA